MSSPHPRGSSAKIRDAWQSGGPSEVMRRAWARARATFPAGPAATLRQVSESDARVVSNPLEAVLDTLRIEGSAGDSQLFRLARSGDALDSTTTPSDWSPEYDLGARSQSALFQLVALTKPDLIVETGVAAGASTTQILSALDQQGFGRLISIDVSHDVGELIPSELKHRWTLVVLPGKRRREALRKILSLHAGYQIFVHDSDHSEKWQRFEYECAAEFAAPEAIICSDDVEASPAFLNFCIARGLHPILLLDRHKVMGLLRLRC
jgi:hypothetical protein